MVKSKKQMFIIIGVFVLTLLLGTTTYAFFNYTRTGSENTIRVGRIAFESSQNGNINLTNAFPIDSEQAQTDTTNAKSVSITVTGDTDYTGGVEYLVSASDVNLSVGGKQLPVALEISVEGNNSKTLGTLETGDYYTNRENYQVSKYKIEYDGKIEEGSHLLVGYIAPNTVSGTAEGIGGVINIKAYIDSSKVLISDTYDGTESDNMGTLNSMAEGKTVFTTTEWNGIQNSPLSFKVKVEANEGIWVKEIRTLYGIMQDAAVMDNIQSTYVSASTGIDFGEISSDTNGKGVYERAGTQNDAYPIYYYRGEIDNNNVVFANKCWKAVRTTDTGGVKLIYNGENIGTSNEPNCNNTGSDTGINLSGTNIFAFNTSYDSPAYVGYMYGDVYAYNQGVATSGAYFGSSFTWDGTNYKLLDPVTTKNNTHHYTCNLTTAEGTCATIRYYHYGNYYVNLTSGEGIERAMEKMQTNTNNSNAKTQIDNWYASNMNTVTSKLEDTIWCNDRSVGNGNNNGWIANGGDLSTYLYYGAYQRSNYASNASTVKNQPSLACANKNDAFTVGNGNGNQKLTYPVALLTEDEMVLAGGVAGAQNTTFYLNNGSYYWSLSPSHFRDVDAYEFGEGDGDVNYYYVDDTNGLRPSVSLKLGTSVASGTGTVSDPFVIE